MLQLVQHTSKNSKCFSPLEFGENPKEVGAIVSACKRVYVFMEYLSYVFSFLHAIPMVAGTHWYRKRSCFLFPECLV